VFDESLDRAQMRTATGERLIFPVVAVYQDKKPAIAKS
jgi:hypothetical protein